MMQSQAHILALIKKIIEKVLKLKAGDHVRISKYKSVFAKGYVANWSEEVFVFKKVKNTVPCTYGTCDFKGEEILGTIFEIELQKTNQKDFRTEKIIKRKGDKPYVKWKGCDNLFNSWIYKNDIV